MILKNIRHNPDPVIHLVCVADLKAHLSAWLKKVTYRHQRVRVHNACTGELLAVIVPVEELARLDYLASRVGKPPIDTAAKPRTLQLQEESQHD